MNVDQQWSQWDVLRNATVNVQANDQTQQGIARGIDLDGCLLLETSQGIQKISVGDVSVRASA